MASNILRNPQVGVKQAPPQGLKNATGSGKKLNAVDTAGSGKVINAFDNTKRGKVINTTGK